MPAERAVESSLLSIIGEVFTLYGFEDVQHRSVEPVPVLLSKGETSKEVYVLSRLQDAYESEDGVINLRERLSSKKQLGLHFDLTVPFARYVLDAAHLLHFPFRRSSIGKVWRGERPQAGRFREFVQADVDIVAEQANGISSQEALGVFNDVEVVKVILQALQSLEVSSAKTSEGARPESTHPNGRQDGRQFNMPPVKIHINNRKLLQGCFEALGVQSFEKVLQTLDKLPKLGVDAVSNELINLGESADVVEKCLQLAQIQGDKSFLDKSALLQGLTSQNALAKEGFDELIYVLEELNTPQCIANLSITRGLDYYTGSVFETFIDGFESYGSVASGGRYDNLASTLGAQTKVNYPGVGMSIGVSRLLAIGFENDFFKLDGYSPVEVMVAVNSAETRPSSNQVADALRNAGISAMVSPNHAKFGKQIDFAYKRGIVHIVFIDDDNYRLKNVFTGQQSDFSSATELAGALMRKSL
ncbi:MAG: histidine--tRNA ligase [Candidatus Ancillula sp.]|nr:histidine--tRNA ligase [Candidatus Ancillula sp.]